MLKVGLTGGIASGKSVVGEMLVALGAHLVQADRIAHSLMQPGEAVYNEVVRHFGREILNRDLSVNRAKLAEVAFGPANAPADQRASRIEELNRIVHPAVIAAQAKWMEEIAAKDPNAIAMVESALIFETKYGGDAPTPVEGDSEDREIAAAISTTGWQTRFDRILLVTAREDLKIARYIQRVASGRSLTAAERAALQDDARRRLAAQIADEVKSPLCDYVIENNGDPAALDLAVRRIFAALRSSAAALARQTR